ncbi:hypothetical protein F2Q69_00059048 [Brassica cretica]|uniref:Uncharacterized protein n=1 Tax=Brassica cretica TaxID=69181 RepID=A0A8S9RHM6_BRACR|nr:hypothetical protein F2Q69_00059048 [Brassica cretica]
MSGNTKDKIQVRNNAGKKTPAATAPLANAYANATVLEKLKSLAATFRPENFLSPKPQKIPRIIAEKGSPANRVHNSPLHFF